jgi:hypothetical protein
MQKSFLTSLILVTLTSTTLNATPVNITQDRLEKPRKTFSTRRYSHVKNFFANIASYSTTTCVEQNIPPAALLAIAALESGWNRGYVGRITGNILSLGLRKGDIRLPALTLPVVIESGKILFDPEVIKTYKSSELRIEKRPPSLKKDYRPAPYTGSLDNLAYLDHHPKEKAKAQQQNIKDFVTIFVSRTSSIKAYRDTRAKMDRLVALHGKEILLKKETALAFVYGIGGKKRSYNNHKAWPKKVEKIMKNAGLVDLTQKLYDKKSFKESW